MRVSHAQCVRVDMSASIEYGSEVWEGNKSQAGSLESILDGAKRILGCSSKTSMRQLEETWA